MCDCWLIDRAATPIVSTGGAASSPGTTSSGSIAVVHGQRGCSRCSGSPITSATANTRRHTAAYRTSRSPGVIRGRRGKPVTRRSVGHSSSQASGSGLSAEPTAFSQYPARLSGAGLSGPA